MEIREEQIHRRSDFFFREWGQNENKLMKQKRLENKTGVEEKHRVLL